MEGNDNVNIKLCKILVNLEFIITVIITYTPIKIFISNYSNKRNKITIMSTMPIEQ